MNRIYFICASALFLFSVYQVNISSTVITTMQSQIPAHLERAFKAGCFTMNKSGCPSEAAKFRNEQESIYN